ncbi:MAG: HAD-IIA family hydrolase [Micrococcales bacterium]|nr:HAD-IIA family hydrolase [Micrococcales bacterium]
MSLLAAYQGIVCDLDGVVYRGHAAVPHAVEALNEAGLPVVYATNNASRPATEVAEHLSELGIADASRVLTSSQAGAAAMAETLAPGSRVLAVGGAGVGLALEEVGLVPVSGRPGEPVSGVLQGYGPQVSATDLAEAAYAIQGGAHWIATNDDLTLPTDRGMAPGNGSFVAALRNAVEGDPQIVGKPHPPLYLRCAQLLGTEVSDTLAIGDRLSTDIAGGVATGMDSVLVLTGVDGASEAALADPALRPTFVVVDLRGLAEDYAGVAEDDGWHVCGETARRIVGGQWQTRGAEDSIESVRAGIAALQEARDAGAVDQSGAEQLAALLRPAQ